MNWYVRDEGTDSIAGPMSQAAALKLDGLAFSEEIFEPKIVTTSEVDRLLAEMNSVASAGIVIPHIAQELLKRAIDTIILLSREKVITGTIEGGVLSLDEVSDGVIVDIRDYDCDGDMEDENGSFSQAG